MTVTPAPQLQCHGCGQWVDRTDWLDVPPAWSFRLRCPHCAQTRDVSDGELRLPSSLPRGTGQAADYAPADEA